MSNAIKDVISLCGIGVLADVSKFQAAIKDFLFNYSLRTEQQLLIFSIKIGIGEELLKAVNKPASEQNKVLSAVNTILTAEYSLTKEQIKSIIDSFVSALDLQKDEIIIIPNTAKFKESKYNTKIKKINLDEEINNLIASQEDLQKR